MDPQANAQEQVSLARMLLEMHDRGEGLDPHDVGQLAELVLALAKWRSVGGVDVDWAVALDQA